MDWETWNSRLKGLAKRAWSRIKAFKRVILVGDNDPDGIMATLVMKHILEKKRKEVVEIFFDEHNFHKDNLDVFLREIAAKYPQSQVIFLDLPVSTEVIAAAGFGERAAVIDHHHEGCLEADFLFDPRNEGIRPVPSTSEVVYFIAKAALKKKAVDLAPFAAIGAFGDYMVYPKSKLMKDLQEHFPVLYSPEGTFTPAFFALNLIAVAFIERPYLLVNHFRNPIKMVEQFRDELVMQGTGFLLAISDFKILETRDVIVVRARKASKVASYLPFYAVYGTKPLLVFSEQGEVLKISLRIPKALGLHAGRIMKEFTEKHGVIGGGHPEAAGGKIKKQDLKRLVEYIKTKLKAPKKS